MSVTVDPGVSVTFSYAADDLFNLASLRSMYRGKNLKNQEGTTEVDAYAISEDERDAFNIFVGLAAHLAFKTVLKLTKGITDAITVNTSGNIELEVLDNAAYNDNVLNYVDTLIKETIVFKVLSEWYKTCGLDAEYNKMENEFLRYRNELYEGLFELRKPLIT